MNSLMKTVEDRRSIRRYTGEPVPEEALRAVLRAGLLSPTGRNRRPWEFIVVRNRETLERMVSCRTGGAAMLAEADCAVVVLGDRRKSDTLVEDCSIAMAQMHLMASSLGVGSCWIQGRLREAADGRSAEEYLRSLLGFPEEYQLEAILSLGMPAEHPAPHTEADADWSRVRSERF